MVRVTLEFIEDYRRGRNYWCKGKIASFLYAMDEYESRRRNFF